MRISFAYGKCEDLFVTHGLFRSAGFLNGGLQEFVWKDIT